MNNQIDIIAEIGQAHEGSLGMAHAYIDALADTGVNAVKFQIHLADAESSIYEPFRVKFSYEDETRFDYWKRMEFSLEQWAGLKRHCSDCGLEFLASPFSLAAVDLLESLDVARYKIGSGEVTNLLMLEKIARTGKPILLSSGMSSWQALDTAIDFLRPFRNHLSVLQCTTAYPTLPAQWGLNVLTEIQELYQCPVGFSDHSGDIFACLAAAALGAQVLEFHVVFDKKMFGPDATSSLTMEQVRQLVEGVRQIETARKNPMDKSDDLPFLPLKLIFEKSLAINKDLPSGHILTMADLETKKPAGFGIPASQFKTVIGRTLNRTMRCFDFLREEDLV